MWKHQPWPENHNKEIADLKFTRMRLGMARDEEAKREVVSVGRVRHLCYWEDATLILMSLTLVKTVDVDQ